METLPLFPPQSLSISNLTRYLRELLESDDVLRDVWVQGEISNFTRAASGHVYLTLKDSGAALRCVIWKSSALRIRTAMQNGLAVEAHGAIGIYERDGAYQLYIDAVRPVGEGFLYQEFLHLKARLEAEGLFEEERKRAIPAFPRRIGLVTSPTGAALQDMLNTLTRRYPLAEVLLAPSAVQGEDAPLELVRAIGWLQFGQRPDVIIVARGGGSLEDLWAFNDERVVRAIAASNVPVITGIGHETDFTLADFAADLRAPTPTAAASLATPDRVDLRLALERLENRLHGAARQQVSGIRAGFGVVQAGLERNSPLRRLQDERQRVDEWIARAQRAALHLLELRRSGRQGASARLQALNPLSVLERGYAVVLRLDGSLLTRAEQAQPGQTARVRLADGTLAVKIDSVEKNL